MAVMRWLGLMVSGLLIVGCQSMSTEATGDSSNLEPIYNPEWTANGLTVQVVSNGCTSVESFKVQVTDNQVTIDRIKKDHCRAMPRLVEVSFPLANQTKSSMKIVNPVLMADKDFTPPPMKK